MAGKVIGAEKHTYEEKPNQVLAVADVKMSVIKYTGTNGRVEDAIVLVYGEASDHQPGVFVLIDGDKMRDNVTVAAPHIRKGVLEALGKADSRAQTAEAQEKAGGAAAAALGV